jgi:hypothetical protein
MRARDERNSARAEMTDSAKQSIEPQNGLLPPTRKGASADSKPAIARIASDGGSSRALLAMTKNQFARISALIMSAAFSPIMMVGALVLPPIRVGMIEASTTRKP